MSNFTLTGLTPTVNQFLTASARIATGRFQNFFNAYSPLKIVPGSSQLNVEDGMYAATFKTPKGQYIISYNGTDGMTPAGHNKQFYKNQQKADVVSANYKVSPGQKDAAAYANTVIKTLEDNGVARKDIFVTGYSLGSILAQYASQQTGLAGMAFEGTGIPVDPSKDNPGNFISVASYGDIVPALSSDVKGLQPLAPKYDPRGGALPHYGSLVMVGNPRLQPILHAQGLAGKAVSTGVNVAFGADAAQQFHDKNVMRMVKLNLLAHDPRVIAKELGADLSLQPATKILNAIPNPILSLAPSAPVALGKDTLPELAQHVHLQH